MFERFTPGARSVVIEAQKHARRLGHRYIGCEHLLLAVASSSEPVSAVLADHGVTAQAVESEIGRLTGAGEAAGLLGAVDRDALASIGIDFDVVRARIEAVFGPDALTRCPSARQRHRGCGRSRVGRLLRRRAGTPRQSVTTSAGTAPTGHIPFSPRAKKSLQLALREAKMRHDSYIGAEHLTLALVAMHDGAVPPILSWLGVPAGTLRSAIIDRYRQAS